MKMMQRNGEMAMGKDILVTRSSMPDFDEYVNEIKDLWDSHWLTNMGKKHQTFEKELKEYLGVENIQLFVNGHMALELALQSLQLKGEVITTPFTFASTTHAIVRNGLEPVFCDIRESDYTMDADLIEPLITEKTCAIVPVHVYGNICQVEKIQALADKYGLKVIYDAAHCFGEKYKGAGVGSFGDMSMFSFHATKVFNSIEGGAITFSDKSKLMELYHLKNFGILGEEHVYRIGANAKMNEFQAAMGICNLRHVDDEIAKRRKVHERYISGLSGIDGVKLPLDQEDVERNYAYFPVVFDPELFGADRDVVYNALAQDGIHARKYFYPITNSFECYENRFDIRKTPIALKISRQVLTLPMYADLALEDVDRICGIIRGLKP